MQIGIIGAGRVGCSIGKYLMEGNVPVTGYYSRTVGSADEAARFTGTVRFNSISEIVKANDTLFITTPDDGIADVWDCIAGLSVKNKIICHFSGSLSSVVFSGIESTGASGCSIHPMLAFSNKFSSYKQLNNVLFTIEGMDSAVSAIKNLFETMGNKVFEMKTDEKARYHAAASIVSNHMIALYQMGIDNLMECGFSEKDAQLLVMPLVRGNVNAFLENGPEAALTGPVERNDVSTVANHLKVLSGDDKEVYRCLAKRLVKIAEGKNSDRDYSVMERVLEKEGI